MKTEEKDIMNITREGAEEEVQEEEEDDDDEGPPPGFQFITPQTEEKIIVKEEQKDAGINANRNQDVDEDDEDEDIEGPPPGWSSIPPPSTTTTTTLLQPIHPSDVEMLDKQEEVEDEEGPPPGWHSLPQASQLAESVPAELESHEVRTKGADEESQPELKSVPSPKLLPPTAPPLPPAVPSPSEKGQMVCGSCRRLLSYPRGVKYVQCSCCQTVNLVLEDHQVGQVKCGGCAVLLMYPYGAPSVRCCSCRFVTEIGVHNRRPPLSVQQAKARRPPFVNRVH